MEGKEKRVSVMRASADLIQGRPTLDVFCCPFSATGYFTCVLFRLKRISFSGLTPFERIAILGQHRGRNTRS